MDEDNIWTCVEQPVDVVLVDEHIRVAFHVVVCYMTVSMLYPYCILFLFCFLIAWRIDFTLCL